MPNKLGAIIIVMDKVLSLLVDWHVNLIDWLSSKLNPKRLGKHINDVQRLNIFSFLF